MKYTEEQLVKIISEEIEKELSEVNWKGIGAGLAMTAAGMGIGGKAQAAQQPQATVASRSLQNTENLQIVDKYINLRSEELKKAKETRNEGAFVASDLRRMFPGSSNDIKREKLFNAIIDRLRSTEQL